MTNAPLGHEFLLGAYEALFKDIVRWLPTANSKNLSWDLSQLERLARDRGQRYFTIDLPDWGKAFEQSLDSGSLAAHSVPGFGKLGRTKRGLDVRPRLFWALTSRVFRRNGTLRDTPCTTSIWLLRQVCNLFKKLEGECSDEFKFKATGDLFSVEHGLPGPSLDWEDPSGLRDSGVGVSFADGTEGACASLSLIRRDSTDARPGRHLGECVQRVFDILGTTLPEFNPDEVKGRHGPGAVSDGTWSTSKYVFPSWPDKLQSIFPFDWHASTNLMDDGSEPTEKELFSKLIMVPKTHKAPRLIASEPICNQWIQQGLEDWFLDAFGKTFIGQAVKINDQSRNQAMAREASYGGLATLDLSAASDRLTCFVVERAFRVRPDLLSAMMACRTPLLRNCIDKKQPELLRLKKFAMMGSALTFPVQSYVFFGFAVASVLWSRGLRVTRENITSVLGEVSVYGDDIIVPVDSRAVMVDLLQICHLKVNVLKSFWTGKFRESCGTDWYEGVCVTPSYIKADFDPKRPTTLTSVVECSNNFYKKGLWSVADYLVSRIPYRMRLKLAVEDGSVAIKGLFSYAGVKLDHLRRRWHDELQRWEFRVIGLTVKLVAPRPDGIFRLRQYFTECPSPNESWDPRTSGRSVPGIRERYQPLYSGG